MSRKDEHFIVVSIESDLICNINMLHAFFDSIKLWLNKLINVQQTQ